MLPRLTRWVLLALVIGTLCTFAPIAAQNAPTAKPAPAAGGAIPRTADGKPDFTGTYQWPTYLPGAQRGRSAATVFDSKNFAPLKEAAIGAAWSQWSALGLAAPTRGEPVGYAVASAEGCATAPHSGQRAGVARTS